MIVLSLFAEFDKIDASKSTTTLLYGSEWYKSPMMRPSGLPLESAWCWGLKWIPGINRKNHGAILIQFVTICLLYDSTWCTYRATVERHAPLLWMILKLGEWYRRPQNLSIFERLLHRRLECVHHTRKLIIGKLSEFIGVCPINSDKFIGSDKITR